MATEANELIRSLSEPELFAFKRKALARFDATGNYEYRRVALAKAKPEGE